ncbi:MAG: hypothetical protein ACLTXL_01535 [Clostridia bacterium]
MLAIRVKSLSCRCGSVKATAPAFSFGTRLYRFRFFGGRFAAVAAERSAFWDGLEGSGLAGRRVGVLRGALSSSLRRRLCCS